MNPLGKSQSLNLCTGELRCIKEPLIWAIILLGLGSCTCWGSGHIHMRKNGWGGGRLVCVHVYVCVCVLGGGLQHWWTAMFGQFHVDQWPTAADRVELDWRVFHLAVLYLFLSTAQSQVFRSHHNTRYCGPSIAIKTQINPLADTGQELKYYQ